MSDWKLGVWGLRKPSRTSTVEKLYFHIVFKKYCEDKLFCLVEHYTTPKLSASSPVHGLGAILHLF